jgi:hypothetical protein
MVSIHPGRKDMVEQSSSHHGDWEAERENALADFLLFSSFIPCSLPVYGMVLPTFRAGLPPLVNSL